MEAARPLSSLLCDRIGTRLRHFRPAVPALLALKTRTLNPNNRLGPNFPAAGLAVQDLAERPGFVQRLPAVCLRGGRPWQRQMRAISRSGRSLITPERIQADAPWTSLPRFVGGGYRRCLGLARRPGADAAIALAGRRKALLPVLRPFPRRPDPARPRHAYFAGADRRGFVAAGKNNRLRADLFGRLRPRPDRRDRGPPRPQSDAGPLAIEPCGWEPRADRDRGGAGQPLSRHDPSGGGRQRGAVARGNVGRGSRHHHARGEGARWCAGDLCRCVGVLAAKPRARRRRRFHHHSYPALLGGLSEFRRATPPRMWTRSAAAWWKPFPAKR